MKAHRLFVVRDFAKHYDCLGLTIEGGLLADSSANHFFMFMARKGSSERSCET